MNVLHSIRDGVRELTYFPIMQYIGFQRGFFVIKEGHPLEFALNILRGASASS